MTPVDPHVEGEIQRLLAEDADIAELGIEVAGVDVGEHPTIVLRGCVNGPERRTHIVDRVRAAFPDIEVTEERSFEVWGVVTKSIRMLSP